jgi:hypothetical protein
MTTRRVLASINPQHNNMTVNGRSFSLAPGTPYDIATFDAGPLGANGNLDLFDSGPTSARPSSAVGLPRLYVGALFVDTTINAVIAYDGQNWRSVITGVAV